MVPIPKTCSCVIKTQLFEKTQRIYVDGNIHSTTEGFLIYMNI